MVVISLRGFSCQTFWVENSTFGTPLQLTMHKILCLLLLASAPVICNAQAVRSTGDYKMDLGQLYGATQIVGLMGGLCIDAFPEMKKTIDQRYHAWRESNLPVLQEIERHWQHGAMVEARGDPDKLRLFQMKYARTMASFKAGLHEWLVDGGTENARTRCEKYPSSLGAERTTFLPYFSEQLATIRRKKLPF